MAAGHQAAHEALQTVHQEMNLLRPNIQMTVDTVPIIEKVEKIVEVHQLQFPYQVVDVLMSRNGEYLSFRSEAHDRCPRVRSPED